MVHLLQLEWKKLRHYRLFMILIAIYMIALPAMFLSGASMGFNEIAGGPKGLYIFPAVWKYLGYLGNWMTFFCFGFLGVSLVTMEFANKTLRQNIITGMSRKSFFLGKIYIMVVISAFAALYYLVIGLIFGFVNTDYVMTSRVMEGFMILPRYFLMCFAYMIVAFTLGLLIRRSGIALFIFFTYSIMGEQILRYFVHHKISSLFNNGNGFNDAMNYYPINAIEDLVPLPMPKEANQMMQQALDKGYNFFLTPVEATFITLFYLTLFIGLAYYVFRKRDL